jgi:hypothetical protein
MCQFDTSHVPIFAPLPPSVFGVPWFAHLPKRAPAHQLLQPNLLDSPAKDTFLPTSNARNITISVEKERREKELEKEAEKEAQKEARDRRTECPVANRMPAHPPLMASLPRTSSAGTFATGLLSRTIPVRSLL